MILADYKKEKARYEKLLSIKKIDATIFQQAGITWSILKEAEAELAVYEHALSLAKSRMNDGEYGSIHSRDAVVKE